MKKVRFESPVKSYKIFQMDESECQLPRPFIERQVSVALPSNEIARRMTNRDMYHQDPVQTFDHSNTSPYPVVRKTMLTNTVDVENGWSPSNDLDLSILDSSNHDSRGRVLCGQQGDTSCRKPFGLVNHKILTETNKQAIVHSSPNILNRNDDFFLRRGSISHSHVKDIAYKDLNRVNLDKENKPNLNKLEVIKRPSYFIPNGQNDINHQMNMNNCMLHNGVQCISTFRQCPCLAEVQKYYPICNCTGSVKQIHCDNTPSKSLTKGLPQNSVNKKNWLIERIQSDKECGSDVSKIDDNEKSEPTMSDLFKIIKLQNEQLQMLQQKVDKFMQSKKEMQPISNYVKEHVALESVQDQKMSIGVMTSFEMVRTSTIINKEIVTKNEAQIQCNRSQISIKEVVSKLQPTQPNFLDGISMTCEKEPIDRSSMPDNTLNKDFIKNTDNIVDDKTLNELSLYNVQVDNATTPLMSPDQSLYLDVRDFSDSDSGSDDQSNVGWTYYNKVMTHVNGMLHESDMPSSASALYRNTRQKCLHMKIDKTNVSVAKRVTFGDDLMGMQQQNQNIGTTDTSLKMNQLAAKYLKSCNIVTKSPSPTNAISTDMSYATKNYMEKHKILQGSQKATADLPKFLDITALKQQTKLL